MSNIRFSCTRSGKCCKSQGEPGFVALNSEDIERLEKHLGKPRSSFAVAADFSSFRYQKETHARWVLKDTHPQCSFLVDNQCSIHEVKPLQCRTWPFWPEFIDGGELSKEKLSFCKGVGRGEPIPWEQVEAIMREDAEGFDK